MTATVRRLPCDLVEVCGRVSWLWHYRRVRRWQRSKSGLADARQMSRGQEDLAHLLVQVLRGGALAVVFWFALVPAVTGPPQSFIPTGDRFYPALPWRCWT